MSVVMADCGELGAIFKAYDVRGDRADRARRGAAASRSGPSFARFARRVEDARRLAVAHDMRISGVELADAFTAGVESEGAEVVLVGLASTDLLYFASGVLGVPGAMLTASHNPPEYNGIKFCLAGARPVGQDTGLAEIRRAAEETMLAAVADVPAPLATELTDGTGRASSPATSVPSSTCRAFCRCGSSPTRRTAWAASSRPRLRRACPAPSTCSSASSTGPSRTTRRTRSAGEPGGPARPDPRDRGRRGSGLRRRRRPGVRRRRARRAAVGLDDDGDRRPGDAGEAPRRDRPCTT